MKAAAKPRTTWVRDVAVAVLTTLLVRWLWEAYTTNAADEEAEAGKPDAEQG